MVNRILSAIGWIGMALVVAAVGIRFGLPAREQYAYYLAWGGLVCVLIYTLGQWREIAGAFSGRQARYGTLAGVSILVVLGILVAINYIGSKQNKRWDLTTNKQFSLSDQSRNVLAKLDSPMQIRVFAQEPEFQRYRDKLKEYEYASKKVSTEYIDPDKKPTVARQAASRPTARSFRLQGPHRAHHLRHRAGVDQYRHQGRVRQAAQGVFHPGHGERDTASSNGGIQRDHEALATRTTP
jgi:hypothetical protein